MNQQPADTDSLFRATEDQSLPDLSSIDLHWQEMKNLLVVHPSTGIQKTVVNQSGLVSSFAIMLFSCLFIVITSKPSMPPVNKNPTKPIPSSLKDTIPPSIVITTAKQPAQFKTLQIIPLDTAPARKVAQFNAPRVIRLDTVLTSSVSLLEIKGQSMFKITTPIVIRHDSIILVETGFSPIRPVVHNANNTPSVDTIMPVKTNRIRPRKIDNSKRMMSDSITGG